MKKNNRGLGYAACIDCNAKTPERDCVSCRLPERESEKESSAMPQKSPPQEPVKTGWSI
jgi:hypothetical protein